MVVVMVTVGKTVTMGFQRLTQLTGVNVIGENVLPLMVVSAFGLMYLYNLH